MPQPIEPWNPDRWDHPDETFFLIDEHGWAVPFEHGTERTPELAARRRLHGRSTAVPRWAAALAGAILIAAAPNAVAYGQETSGPSASDEGADVVINVYGDSYTAGEAADDNDGEDEYLDPTDQRHQSSRAPSAVAGSLIEGANPDLEITMPFAASSGAVTADLNEAQRRGVNGPGNANMPQIGQLPSDADGVVVGLGGNDAKFAGVLTAGGYGFRNQEEMTEKINDLLAEDPAVNLDVLTPDEIAAQIAEARAANEGRAPGTPEVQPENLAARLAMAYQDIRAQHPDAAMVVVNYPVAVDPETEIDAPLGFGFTTDELTAIAEFAGNVNSQIDQAIANCGCDAALADVSEALEGFEAGRDPSDIVSLDHDDSDTSTHRQRELFHPKISGAEKIGRVIADVMARELGVESPAPDAEVDFDANSVDQMVSEAPGRVRTTGGRNRDTPPRSEWPGATATEIEGVPPSHPDLPAAEPAPAPTVVDELPDVPVPPATEDAPGLPAPVDLPDPIEAPDAPEPGEPDELPVVPIAASPDEEPGDDGEEDAPEPSPVVVVVPGPTDDDDADDDVDDEIPDEGGSNDAAKSDETDETDETGGADGTPVDEELPVAGSDVDPVDEVTPEETAPVDDGSEDRDDESDDPDRDGDRPADEVVRPEESDDDEEPDSDGRDRDGDRPVDEVVRPEGSGDDDGEEEEDGDDPDVETEPPTQPSPPSEPAPPDMSDSTDSEPNVPDAPPELPEPSQPDSPPTVDSTPPSQPSAPDVDDDIPEPPSDGDSNDDWDGDFDSDPEPPSQPEPSAPDSPPTVDSTPPSQPSAPDVDDDIPEPPSDGDSNDDWDGDFDSDPEPPSQPEPPAPDSPPSVDTSPPDNPGSSGGHHGIGVSWGGDDDNDSNDNSSNDNDSPAESPSSGNNDNDSPAESPSSGNNDSPGPGEGSMDAAAASSQPDPSSEPGPGEGSMDAAAASSQPDPPSPEPGPGEGSMDAAAASSQPDPDPYGGYYF